GMRGAQCMRKKRLSTLLIACHAKLWWRDMYGEGFGAWNAAW
ncbi:hypothetical protein A2U01_0075935, partial [Trifolium medium]|nr:hypothetical protein [Trifolium medium]